MRQLLVLVAGLVLVLTAMDVMWWHRLSTPPDTDSNGVLTSRGGAQRRQDILWSSIFLVTGGGTVVLAGLALARRRPILELYDEGLAVRAVGTRDMLMVPWSEIESIRTTVDESSNESADTVLSVTVRDPYLFPHGLWGAQWRDRELRIDADQWVPPAEEVAVHAGVLRDRVALMDDEGEPAESVDEAAT